MDMETVIVVWTIIGTGFVVVWVGALVVLALGMAVLGWKDWKHRRDLKRAGFIFPGDL